MFHVEHISLWQDIDKSLYLLYKMKHKEMY